MSSYKKCEKGVSCSSTCISRNKKCRAELRPVISAQLNKTVKSLNENKEVRGQFENWSTLASGNYGEIAINPEGTRVVKRLLNRKGKGEGEEEFGPYEVEIAKRMGELGHSPRIYSSSSDHIEMDLAPGKPLWQTYRRGDEEPVMNSEQAVKAGRAFRDLHRMGYFHGDAHSQQFLVNGDDVKMVDFGLSGRVEQNPVKVMQDLSKISGLVNWGNPDLKGDPYFALVNRHLSQYREVGKSNSKAAIKRRLEIAENYLKELAEL